VVGALQAYVRICADMSLDTPGNAGAYHNSGLIVTCAEAALAVIKGASGECCKACLMSFSSFG